MATFTVTTAADVVDATDGRLSLREAVSLANAVADADSIRFAKGLEGRKLVLTGGELEVTHDLAIDGDRNHDGTGVTIDADRKSRVIEISGKGTDARLAGLTITGGYGVAVPPDVGSNLKGAGVFLGVGTKLDVAHTTFTGNSTSGSYDYGRGGGIYAAKASRLAVSASRFTNNKAAYGGAIAAGPGATVKITASLIENNAGSVTDTARAAASISKAAASTSMAAPSPTTVPRVTAAASSRGTAVPSR